MEDRLLIPGTKFATRLVALGETVKTMYIDSDNFITLLLCIFIPVTLYMDDGYVSIC